MALIISLVKHNNNYLSNIVLSEKVVQSGLLDSTIPHLFHAVLQSLHLELRSRQLLIFLELGLHLLFVLRYWLMQWVANLITYALVQFQVSFLLAGLQIWNLIYQIISSLISAFQIHQRIVERRLLHFAHSILIQIVNTGSWKSRHWFAKLTHRL